MNCLSNIANPGSWLTDFLDFLKENQLWQLCLYALKMYFFFHICAFFVGVLHKNIGVWTKLVFNCRQLAHGFGVIRAQSSSPRAEFHWKNVDYIIISQKN